MWDKQIVRENIMGFKDVSNKPAFVQLEHDMLQFWEDNDSFNKLRELRAETEAEHGTFSFVDGPITANNPMGVHHGWGRTYKDIYNRYHAMQGKNLRWQNGFDCQGLWVEVNVEKEMGFANKRDIEKYGLAEFIKLCKKRVLKFSAVQTSQSIRLGYWMDWNDIDQLNYLEEKLGENPDQVISVEGPMGTVTGTVEQIVGKLGSPEDVMPWCCRCGTGISQHEIVTDGYQDVTHDSVFIKFPLVGQENTALLAWTTTPWTLSSNVAAAVGPEVEYVKVAGPDDWTYYLAKEAMKNTLIGKLENYEILETLKGSDMVGWEYEAAFDDLPIVQETFAETGYTTGKQANLSLK